MRRYDTSIKSLINAKSHFFIETGHDPIFLSHWDSDFESVHIPLLKYEYNLHDLQKYYFWTDEENYRSYFQDFFYRSFGQRIDISNFTIGNNGTSSIMLALASLKETGKNKALVVTPVYFSTLNLLDEFNFDVVELNLSSVNNFQLDISLLEEKIKKEKIEIVIITNPIFGTGIELPIETLKSISNICNSYNVCFLLDYIYGGLPWVTNNKNFYIFNYPVYEAVSTSKQHVFIESISKRVFLNGAKFSLVFSNAELMRKILRLSIFMVGSMSAQQTNLVPQIYSLKSTSTISNLIQKNAIVAQDRYKMIKNLISDTSIKLSEASYGYFALVDMPKNQQKDDIAYAIDLLNKVGVLTTPHSRYLYKPHGYYSFRLNLLLSKQELLEGITRIKTLI